MGDVSPVLLKEVNLISAWSVLFQFPDGFEHDKVTLTGWDISDEENTSACLIRKQTGFTVLLRYTDEEHLAERGFSGNVDYCFETGEARKKYPC